MHRCPDPDAPPATPIDFETFLEVDIRIGTVTRADAFPWVRKPAWRLDIDLCFTAASTIR